MRPSSKARGGRNLTGFNRRATRLDGMQRPSNPAVILARPLSSTARRLIAGVMLLLYVLLIFGGSSGPAPGAITSLGLPDYLLHAAEFAVLGFLCSRWLLHLTLKTGIRVLVLIPMALCALYGISDEIHQSFVPERDPAVADVLADVVGSLIGALTYRMALLSHLGRTVGEGLSRSGGRSRRG